MKKFESTGLEVMSTKGSSHDQQNTSVRGLECVYMHNTERLPLLNTYVPLIFSPSLPGSSLIGDIPMKSLVYRG